MNGVLPVVGAVHCSSGLAPVPEKALAGDTRTAAPGAVHTGPTVKLRLLELALLQPFSALTYQVTPPVAL